MKTINKIMQCAYELFLKEGFSAVSMADISSYSGVGAGTIYYYFKDKDELILSVLDKYVMDPYFDTLKCVSSFDGGSFEKLRNLYEKFLDLIDSKLLLLSFEGMFKYSSLDEKYNEFNQRGTEYIEKMVREGISNGEIRNDESVDDLVLFIKNNLNGIFFLAIVQKEFNLTEIIDVSVKQVWDYIKNDSLQ